MSGVEYKTPGPLSLDNLEDLFAHWQRFLSSFKIFISAEGLSQVSETRKAAILLNFQILSRFRVARHVE